MKIVKEGNPSMKKKEKSAHCDSCGCEFTYTEDEVKTIFFGPYKKTDTHCPFCGKYLLLAKERIDG